MALRMPAYQPSMEYSATTRGICNREWDATERSKTLFDSFKFQLIVDLWLLSVLREIQLLNVLAKARG
jgi:hypothetical protein